MNLADLIGRVATGLEIPASQAEALVAMGLRFNIPIADFDEIESSPAFLLRPALGDEFVAAVAGQYSYAALSNPANSGILAHVDFVNANATVNVGSQLRIGTPGVAATTTSADIAWADQRMPGSPACTIGGYDSAAHSGTIIATRRILANSNADYEFRRPIILRPGDYLIADLNTVNVAQTVSFRWIEASLGPMTT